MEDGCVCVILLLAAPDPPFLPDLEKGAVLGDEEGNDNKYLLHHLPFYCFSSILFVSHVSTKKVTRDTLQNCKKTTPLKVRSITILRKTTIKYALAQLNQTI